MDKAKWDFQIERPFQDDGCWRISYTLTPPTQGASDERIAIEERYCSAQIAIQEATRLAQIHVADLNGETATLEKPSDTEVPFGEHPRF